MDIPKEYVLCACLVLAFAVCYSIVHMEQGEIRKELQQLKSHHEDLYQKHKTDIWEELNKMEMKMELETDMFRREVKTSSTVHGDRLAEAIGEIKVNGKRTREEIFRETRRIESKLNNFNDNLTIMGIGLEKKINASKQDLELHIDVIELRVRHVNQVLERVMDVFENLKIEMYSLQDDYSGLRKDIQNLQRSIGEEERRRQPEKRSFIVHFIDDVIEFFGSFLRPVRKLLN